MQGRVRSLMSRIGTLEQTLAEAGLPVPASELDGEVQEEQNQPDVSTMPVMAVSDSAIGGSPMSSVSPERDEDPISGDVRRRDCSKAPVESLTTKLRTGSMSGSRPRLHGGSSRYFGLTTNYHIYSDFHNSEVNAKNEAMNTEANRFINRVPLNAQEYLLDCFWSCYNLVIPVIYRDAFETDYVRGQNTHYSGFLHVCMLGIGFRYADRGRPGLQPFVRKDRESIFHKEAKLLVERELRMPGGIPSIQALILLGDLECGVGSYNTGWLYAGMASRLCFDLGLHRDTTGSEISQLEKQVRTTTLWACTTIDRYWGLFLGRPTSIKLADLSVRNKDHPMRDCYPMGIERLLETEIYDSLIQLVEIAATITEAVDNDRSLSDSTAYYVAAGLDKELRVWYDNLDRNLKWSSESLHAAPAGYFFLHQQYHSLFVLLYRPFIPEQKQGASALIVEVARKTCFNHAMEVARIIKAYRRRFEMRTMFVTGLQHAATAALAIVEGMSAVSSKQQSSALIHLQCLAETLNANSAAYFPAKVMSEILFSVIEEHREAQAQNRAADEKTHRAQADSQIISEAAVASNSQPAALSVYPQEEQGDMGMNSIPWTEQGYVETENWSGDNFSLDAVLSGESTAAQENVLDSEIWESIMSMLSQPMEY